MWRAVEKNQKEIKSEREDAQQQQQQQQTQ